MNTLKCPQDVFKSWKMLRQYKTLVLFLQNRGFLQKLSHEENPKLKEYISTLFFDPRVTDKYAIKLFWEDPAAFFGLESSHTSQEFHNLKKPSNYIDIPNLDLSPVELRDALIEGALDKIQAWKPLEIIYEIPANIDDWKKCCEFFQKPLSTILKEVFSPDLKEIQNKKKLFGKIISLIEGQLDLKKFPQSRKTASGILYDLIKGKECTKIAITDSLQKEIKNIIYYSQFGYAKNIKTNKYKVKINLKSDPDAVVAGDATQDCMPFGDGKNTLYSFNPICALLTVQKEIQNVVYRTIAQSVVTKDKDIKVPINDINSHFEAIGSKYVDIADFLKQDVLNTQESYIACDSVEVANNYQTPEYDYLLTRIYYDFFKTYILRFAEKMNLNSRKVVFGMCEYEIKDISKEENTFLPQAPISYSNKYGESVGVLSLEQEFERFFVERNVKTTEIKRPQEIFIKNPHIQYLTFQDLLEVAYIQKKAYEGTSLKQGSVEMENTLIAKDINNAAKGRHNMSLKYITKEGRTEAYLIAYEGKHEVGKYNGDNYEDERKNEPCIYVMDIAKLPEATKGMGKELIEEFIGLYYENYIKKGRFVPIVADAREVSTYKMIRRYLDFWGNPLGLRFEFKQGDYYNSGDDVIYPVLIRPVPVKS
jgi:hypothetical protein